jgi:hypothetical protein
MLSRDGRVSSRRGLPPIEVQIAMHQLTHRTNLLLACLTAIATAAALRLPWFAAATPPSDPDGGASIEDMSAAVGRWFSEGGMSGEQMLTTSQTLLVNVALATVVLSGLFLVPVLRPWVRDVLRVVPLVAPFVVLLALLNPPGANASIEPRWGIFATLALTALMASSAWNAAGMPNRRAATPAYAPPAPPSW